MDSERPQGFETYRQNITINAPIVTVFRALVEPSFTEAYWGVSFVSTWEPGAEMTWRFNGVEIVDDGQLVLDIEVPTRVGYTWHSFSPEWAVAHGFSEQQREALEGNWRSWVFFDLADLDGATELTLTHGGMEAGGEVATNVRVGWPQILNRMKNLLETGAPDGTA